MSHCYTPIFTNNFLSLFAIKFSMALSDYTGIIISLILFLLFLQDIIDFLDKIYNFIKNHLLRKLFVEFQGGDFINENMMEYWFVRYVFNIKYSNNLRTRTAIEKIEIPYQFRIDPNMPPYLTILPNEETIEQYYIYLENNYISRREEVM